MSNRKKSKWERHAQYINNQENHVVTKEELGEDGKTVVTRMGKKGFFTAQRKILKNILTFDRQKAQANISRGNK